MRGSYNKTVKLSELKSSISEPDVLLKDGFISCGSNFWYNLMNVQKIYIEGSVSYFFDAAGIQIAYKDVSQFSQIKQAEIFTCIEAYLKKSRTLKIFKSLQSSNPISSPSELWIQAEETYKILDSQGIVADY